MMLVSQGYDNQRLSNGAVSLAILLLASTPIGPISLLAADPIPQTTHAQATIEGEVNSIGMSFVRLEPAVFRMGSLPSDSKRRSDETQRTVEITKPFLIGRSEVTQDQWKRIMNTEPWRERRYTKSANDFPATAVSWDDVNQFCRELSRKEMRSYRLPTEAEWELACRGGTRTIYSFGSDSEYMRDHGWIGSNSFDIGERYAHPVAKKKPNPLGLYDVHGNVWEWCSDWHSTPAATRVTDPIGPKKGTMRVIRGGSWHGVATLCRSASRFRRRPNSRLNDLGFRVVLEVQPNPKQTGNRSPVR